MQLNFERSVYNMIASELYTVDSLSLHLLEELSEDGQVSIKRSVVSILTRELAGKAGRPSSWLSILLGRNDAWNLLLNEQRFSGCLTDNHAKIYVSTKCSKLETVLVQA